MRSAIGSDINEAIPSKWVLLISLATERFKEDNVMPAAVVPIFGVEPVCLKIAAAMRLTYAVNMTRVLLSDDNAVSSFDFKAPVDIDKIRRVLTCFNDREVMASFAEVDLLLAKSTARPSTETAKMDTWSKMFETLLVESWNLEPLNIYNLKNQHPHNQEKLDCQVPAPSSGDRPRRRLCQRGTRRRLLISRGQGPCTGGHELRRDLHVRGRGGCSKGECLVLLL